MRVNERTNERVALSQFHSALPNVQRRQRGTYHLPKGYSRVLWLNSEVFPERGDFQRGVSGGGCSVRVRRLAEIRANIRLLRFRVNNLRNDGRGKPDKQREKKSRLCDVIGINTFVT